MKHRTNIFSRVIVLLLAASLMLGIVGCGKNEESPVASAPVDSEVPEKPEYVTTTEVSDDEVGVFVGEITGCGTNCALQLDEKINYSDEYGFECATTAIAFSRSDSIEFADKVGGRFVIRGSVGAYRGAEQLMFNENYEVLEAVDLTNAHFEPLLKGEWDLIDGQTKAQSALVLMDYLLIKSDYFDSVQLWYQDGGIEKLQDSDMAIKFTPTVSLNGTQMYFTPGGSYAGAILNLFVTRDGVKFLINNSKEWLYNWDGTLNEEKSKNTEGQDFATYVRDFYVAETTVDSPNVQISEDQAYQIALAQWAYNPEYTDPKTGKEVVIEKMGIVGSAIGYFYLFRMYTVDHEFVKSAYISVETGEYHPDVMDAEM